MPEFKPILLAYNKLSNKEYIGTNVEIYRFDPEEFAFQAYEDDSVIGVEDREYVGTGVIESIEAVFGYGLASRGIRTQTAELQEECPISQTPYDAIKENWNTYTDDDDEEFEDEDSEEQIEHSPELLEFFDQVADFTEYVKNYGRTEIIPLDKFVELTENNLAISVTKYMIAKVRILSTTAEELQGVKHIYADDFYIVPFDDVTVN